MAPKMIHWLTLPDGKDRIKSDDGGVLLCATGNGLSVYLRADYAAAPHLLAALQGLLSDGYARGSVGKRDEYRRAAQAAIAKAAQES